MEAIDRLIMDEGFESHPYECSEGALTIGYGRNISAAGKGITKREALYMLHNDVIECESDLGDLFTWPVWLTVSRTRRDALVNMRYNLGPAGFREFKKMIAAVRLDDWKAAAREALDSAWAKQVGRRAKRIAYELENDTELFGGII